MAALTFLVRGTEGLKKYNYDTKTFTPAVFDTPKRCSTICMSKNGELMAVCNGEKTIVYNITADTVVATLDRPRTMLMVFSPLNTHLVTWRQYVIDENTPENTPNVEIWNISEPDAPVYSFVKRGQSQWEPEWSDDEGVCMRACNAELQFFENNDFKSVAKRLQRDKIGGGYMAPGSGNYHLALYVPSLKGAHAYVQLYQYGVFERQAVIAHRSFAKCDTVMMNFNKSGKYGIIQAASDVDKSGTSYYGQTLLYFITTGGESNQIVLNKNGPVYSVEWNPSRDEFIVLYGFMPCRATLFNTKCDPTHQFGDGHYNEILFNPQGNMVGLCGFGNLRGKMKFFSMENKKLLSDFTAADTTFFEWSPSGDIFLAGTLSPRLRQDNEFKVWNVSGKILLHQKVATPETQLWQLKWVQPPSVLPAPAIPRPLTTQEIAASKPQAYRPPGSRDRAPAAQRSLIDHGGPLPNVNKSGVYKPGHDAQMNQPSKNSIRNQKKRDNRQDDEKWERGVTQEQSAPVTAGVDEKEKKIRNLKKKLFQVTKLKEQQKEGKELEKNQLEKIKTEGVLLAEIKALEIS